MFPLVILDIVCFIFKVSIKNKQQSNMVLSETFLTRL